MIRKAQGHDEPFETLFLILSWLTGLIFILSFKWTLTPGFILALFCGLAVFFGLSASLKEQDRLKKTPETNILDKLESLVIEPIYYRRLVFLCRYGDYLAERLGMLRQYIIEKRLETEHKSSES